MKSISDKIPREPRPNAWPVICVLIGLLHAWGCGNNNTSNDSQGSNPSLSGGGESDSESGGDELTSTAPTGRDLFVESALESGLDFTHFNGMRGRYYFPEIMGAGVAVLDYDNDGDMDVYAVQGNYLGPDGSEEATPSGKSNTLQLSDRLFRNDLQRNEDGTVELHFTDVTQEAGIASTAFGMGVAAGDINNDGYPDLYVTNFGSNTWWLNQGDGTFTNHDEDSGVSDPGLWSASAAFLDFDRDGWLDLFVSEYVHFTVARHVDCTNSRNGADYCGPEVYAGESDRLLRNRGDGTFEDVSLASHIASKAGAGLGVVAADFNGDDWVDIFVTNDGMANFLWMNQKDGTFSEEALLAGCAFNLFGKQEAGMGVDAADFDADGDEDLFMTHLLGEKNTLYVNDSNGLFADRSQGVGLDQSSRPFTAFGTGWLDYDLDGDLDLYAVNGGVKALDSLVNTADSYPYSMPDQLFENQGGRYKPVDGGPGFQKPAISRGSIDADLDNDGDPDLLINDLNGPLRLLLNQTDSLNSWIGFRILDKRTGSDWIGARVALVKNNVPVAWRRVRADGSYCSTRDPRIVFGLGNLKFDSAWIFLPGGNKQSLVPEEAKRGKYNTVRLDR